MDERIAHISEEQLNKLIERYYNNEKIKDLLSEYNIDATPSQLVRLFPPLISNDKCPYCDINLLVERGSRSNSWKDETPKCPSCRHKKDEFCRCKNCRESEQLRLVEERKERQQRIEEERQVKQILLDSLLNINEEKKVDLENISFKGRIYLGAFLREGISEDFNCIRPIMSFNNPLAPTSDLTDEIIEYLRKEQLIVIHPESDPDCFEDVDGETGNYSFYFQKVKWALNVKKEGLNKVPLIDSIINPKYLAEPGEAYEIWRKISLHEAMEYFYHSVNNILGIDYTPGEKTISVLNDLINDYSVSQIYSIIYRSTNNALRYQREKGVTNKHAANSIIGSAQSYAERAKVNKWDLQRYHRLKELPESALSMFFFERVLKIGYAGFNEKPRIIEVQEEVKGDI